MKYASLFLSAVLLAGCSYKEFPAHQQGEKTLDFGMVNSKKIELAEDNSSVKSYIIVTYLNPISHPLVTQEKEKFLIGIYTASGNESAPKVVLKNFTVNEFSKESLNVREVSFNDPLLALVSSANPWSEYLLVEAPKTDKVDMLIGFENDRSKRVTASFRKDY